MKPKNPGLGARMNPIEAALAVQKQTELVSAEEESQETLVVTSIRLPKSVHQALRRIAFEEEISIHSLLREGVDLAIARRRT